MSADIRHDASRDTSTSAPQDQASISEIGLVELGVILKSRWKTLLLVPLMVGIAAYGASWLITPTFTAQTTFLPPQQQQSAAASTLSSLGALAGLAGASNLKSPAEQYVALMESATVSDRLIDQFKLIDVYDSQYRVDARKTLSQHVQVIVGKKDGLITVSVDDESPQRAADMANAYVSELRRMTSILAVTEAQQRRQFFDRQLLETKDKLTAAQRALEGSGFSQGALRSEPRAAAEGYAQLQAEVTSAEVRLQTMRGYLNESSPEFRQAQDRLLALRGQLSRLEKAAPQSDDNNYVGKYREFKYQETLFDLFSRQYELARIDESREGALIQVVDVATAPERKSKPARTMIALGSAVAAGLLLALGILVRHLSAASARDPRRMQRLAALRAALEQR